MTGKFDYLDPLRSGHTEHSKITRTVSGPSRNGPQLLVGWIVHFRKGRCLVVRALSLHAVTPSSNPALTSGLDLFPLARNQLYYAF